MICGLRGRADLIHHLRVREPEQKEQILFRDGDWSKRRGWGEVLSFCQGRGQVHKSVGD